MANTSPMTRTSANCYTDRTHLREIITVRHHLAAVRGVKAVELREQLGEAETLAAYHDHVAKVLASILPEPKRRSAADHLEQAGDRTRQAGAEDDAKRWEILFKAEHIFGIHLRPAVARTFSREGPSLPRAG
jgi:hypothetical protein